MTVLGGAAVSYERGTPLRQREDSRDPGIQIGLTEGPQKRSTRENHQGTQPCKTRCAPNRNILTGKHRLGDQYMDRQATACDQYIDRQAPVCKQYMDRQTPAWRRGRFCRESQKRFTREKYQGTTPVQNAVCAKPKYTDRQTPAWRPVYGQASTGVTTSIFTGKHRPGDQYIDRQALANIWTGKHRAGDEARLAEVAKRRREVRLLLR